MKRAIIAIVICFVILTSCMSEHAPMKERPIDLSNIDSVKAAINGHWYLDDDVEQRILVVNFNEENLDTWNMFGEEYIEEIERTGNLPVLTCRVGSNLVLKDDSVFIYITSLSETGKISVDSLSRSTLILDQDVYTRKR